MVDAEGPGELVPVAIDRLGGRQTAGEVTRPVAKPAQLSAHGHLRRWVHDPVEAGRSTAEIAQRPNAEGFHPQREGSRFSTRGVRQLRPRPGPNRGRPRAVRRAGPGPDERRKSEPARALEIPAGTIEHRIRRGRATARRPDEPLRRRVGWADASEQERPRRPDRRPIGDQPRRRRTETARARARHG